MKRKTTLTEELLITLDTVKRAQADGDFVSRMELLALSFVPKEISISRNWLFSIAASFLLLLSVNFYGISISQNEETITIADSYSLLMNPTKSLYDE